MGLYMLDRLADRRIPAPGERDDVTCGHAGIGPYLHARILVTERVEVDLASHRVEGIRGAQQVAADLGIDHAR
ncbi:hypothetical protein D3C77_317550 [compost metagenome]